MNRAPTSPHQPSLRAWLLDVVVALAAFVYTLLVTASGPGIVVGGGLCAAFAVRSHRPAVAFVAMLAIAYAQVPLGIDVLPADALLIPAIFTVAGTFSWRASLPAAIGALGWLLVAVAPRLEAYFLRIGDLLLLASAVVLAWSWGTFVRARRTFIAAEQQRAVERERTRIARELHDIVSHGLSATVLLAEGAAAQVHTDPDRAEQAMLRVRDTGRNSLGEMRRMLAVLRDDEPAPDLPQPGVADLERLVEDARGTGLPVVLASTARDLPAGLDVTVYRLVQEALTNVRKHAGEGVSRVDVVVEDRGPETVVRVSDDGAGPVGSGSSGRGLVGMRERVQAYAGTLRAGSRATGGFEVEAVLRREAKR